MPKLRTSRQATTKVLNAVLASLAAIGLFGSHVRAESLRGLSATTTTIDRDRERTPSHREVSTIAPHCPAGKSLFFDKLTHSNNGWSSATHTNYRHSLDVALGLFGKGSSPPINTDNVNSQKDQEDRRVRFDLVESDSWHWSPRRGYEKIVPSVRSQSINLNKIATLNNGRTLSSVVTDKVWRSVMPRTDKIELEDGTQPWRMRDMIHVVLLVIA